MPNHKTKLIINPNADLGKAWRSASDLRPVVEEFGGGDWSGTVYPNHAVELARQAAEEGYSLVIAVGGDGTIHEVVNGVMQLPAGSRPRMGVVPLGSGNDFAHSLGYDSRPAYALRQIFTGQPRWVDIGKMTDNLGRCEYWDNTVGVGFDSTVTIRSRKFTVVRGFLIYLLAVVQTIILNHDAPHMQVRTDLENWEDDLIMFVGANGQREGGGFLVTPEAKIDDGIFHYAAIRKVSRPMMFRLLPEVMNGTHGRFKQVRMGQFHTLELKADRPLYIHEDGEIFAGFGMNVHQISLEILPRSLEFMV